MAVIMSKQLVVPEAPSKGTLASDIEVGGSVFLNVNGTLKEFLIVHQGNPDSSLYDASCDGTWLLMKDVYENRVWHTSKTSITYNSSSIHSHLNSSFLALLDETVQNAVKQVKIPYVSVSGGSWVASGSSGLSCKIFLLSGYEVGWTSDTDQNFAVDGACLSYFSGTAETDSKRTAYMNGTVASWWLRSPSTAMATTVPWLVTGTGGCSDSNYCHVELGIRPALILPSNALFDPDTKEFVGVA